jgi:beta-glucanase (GH16 family)
LRSAFYLAPCDLSWPPGLSVTDFYGQKPDTLFNEARMLDSLQEKIFRTNGINGADGFHTYTMEWLPDQIIWYVDGMLTHRAYRTIATPMYLFAEVSAGPFRQSAPDSTVVFPTKMEIDYIRVYSK